ncbi:YfhO family protein [Eggerthellaceae bacterium 24-137]
MSSRWKETLRRLVSLADRYPRTAFFVVYTLLFALTALACFLPFIANGKSFIWSADGLSQHYNALMYLGDWLREIARSAVSGNFAIPLWEFGAGYGSDAIATIHYYALGDPLNLISAIVPSSMTEYLYGGLVVLRIYLSGLAFVAYCRCMGRNSRAALLCGALIYAFCGWTLFGAVRHPYFVNPLIYFPLLLVGAEKILRGNDPRLFIVMVFISVVSNFYFFYMLIVLAVFYVLVRVIAWRPQPFGRFFLQTLLRFVASGLVGVCMGAIVLVPVLVFVAGSDRLGADLAHDLFYSVSYYGRLAGSIISVSEPDMWAVLGFSAPTLLGVFALLARRGHRLIKVGLAACVLVLLLPDAGSALNGFSYVTNRWSWACALAAAYAFVVSWPYLLRPTRKQALFCVVGCALYVVAVYLAEGVLSETAFASIERAPEAAFVSCCILFTAALLVCARVGKVELASLPPTLFSTLMTIMVVAGICINGHYLYAPDEGNYVSQFVDAGRGEETIAATPLSQVDVLMGDEPLRCDQGMVAVKNASLQLDLSTTQYYWSLANGEVSSYLLSQGIPDMQAHAYNGVDQRSYLEALACTKYYVTLLKDNGEPVGPVPFGFTKVDEVVANRQEVKRLKAALQKETGSAELGKEQKKLVESYAERYGIYENEHALPFGYTFDECMSESRYAALSIEQRQEAMLQAAVLEDDQIGPALSQVEVETVSTQQHAVPYTCALGAGVKQLDKTRFFVSEKNAAITLNFEGAAESETYLVAEGLEVEPLSVLDMYLDGDDQLYPRAEFDSLPLIERNAIELEARQESHWNASSELFPLTVSTDGISKTLNYKNSYYQWNDGQDDFLVNLGYSKEGTKAISISFPRPGVYRFEDLRVVCQSMEKYEELVESLGRYSLDNVRVGGNKVAGTIAVPDERVLCVSVPYSAGWRVRIDGVETPLLKVNEMYIGARIVQGEHEIEFVYETPGLRLGAALSAAGVVLFVLVCVCRRRATGKRGRDRGAL